MLPVEGQGTLCFKTGNFFNIKKSVSKTRVENPCNLWQKECMVLSHFIYRVLFFLFFSSQVFFAQQITNVNDSIAHKKIKKIIVGATSGVVATGSLIYLNQLWYKPYASGNFHFFNDDDEWLQMDKAGHAFTTYNVGRMMMGAMNNAGFSKNKSIFIGGSSGLAYMTAIEVMDGFSSGWGFSWGDMAANFGGSALAISQQYFWDEQRISLKYSFHQTSYPPYRPSELGSALIEQTIKDYNGQTYWLSVNISSFLRKENKFPKWINVAFGYGAEGMISGSNNYVVVNSDGSIIGNNRYRKCVLSLDVDFTKIKTKSHFLKGVFSVVNCLKIPFPTIEFGNSSVKFSPLYF